MHRPLQPFAVCRGKATSASYVDLLAANEIECKWWQGPRSDRLVPGGPRAQVVPLSLLTLSPRGLSRAPLCPGTVSL